MIRRLVLFGAIALALGAHTFVTNRETKDAEPRGAKIVDLPGGDLRYRDQGDRDDPVVVLLHGYTASLEWWDEVAPELVRRGRRVLRFDLLGHGGSEKPREGYAIEDQAERIAAALKKLRVRRAAVIGHSMGGIVASALAEKEPQLVRRVGVLGSAPKEGFAELPLTARIGRWPVVGQLGRRFAPDQVLKAGLDSAFADDTEVPNEFVDHLDGMTYTAYRDASEATGKANEDRPASERVRRSGRPLLVIFGTEDELVEPEAADVWQREVPRARVVKLEETGHSPHWEEPRQVVREILDFTD